MLSERITTVVRGRALNPTGMAVFARGRISSVSRVKAAKFHSSHLPCAEIVKVPQMAESIREGTLRTWLKQPGDTVQADEEVVTIETDKIDVSVNAPAAGTITEHLALEEETVTVGQDLFRLEPGEVGTSKPGSEPNPAKETKANSRAQHTQQAVPPPTRSKEGGERKKQANDSSEQPLAKAEPQSALSHARERRNETRVKMNRIRLRVAERLKESQNTAAALTTFNEIDMSSLMEFWEKSKDEVMEVHDVKLGYMSAFAKACCLALKEIPAVNASIEGDEVVFRNYVDLNVVVATPKGFVTPVVRNAESMNFLEIEREIASLAKKARDGTLSLEDMAGGTFAISNSSVFGSLYGTPMINLPQSAVLGMHAIKERTIVVNGQIVTRPIMVVALTYDHRLLDGREGTTFLIKVRNYLEDPRKMLLV